MVSRKIQLFYKQMVKILIHFAKFSSIVSLHVVRSHPKKAEPNLLKTRLHDSNRKSFLSRRTAMKLSHFYGTSCTAGKYMEPSCICAIILIAIFQDDPDLLAINHSWFCTLTCMCAVLRICIASSLTSL